MRSLLLPLVIVYWAADTLARKRGWRSGPRYGNTLWSIWWRFGYSGPYQFGWLYKRRDLRPLDILLPHRQVWRSLR